MGTVFEAYMSKCAEIFFEHPALKAIEVATRAVEEDNKGNYIEAVHLYELALEHFRHASREVRTDGFRKLLRSKCPLYSDRIKQIRKYLQEQGKGAKPLNDDGHSGQQEDYLLSDDDEFPKKKRWFLLCC